MNRLNIILLALIVVQVAWLIGEDVLIGESYRPRRTVTGDRLFPEVGGDQAAASIEIVRGTGRTVLERAGDGWVVASEGGRKADQRLVESALRALEDLKPGNIVSENPAMHEAFDVVGDNAIEVAVKNGAGGDLARFVLGKTTSDWSGVYIRCPVESDDVMLVKSNIRNTFDRDGGKAGAWRDRTVFSVDSKLVRCFEILKADETIVIERQLSVSTEEGREGEQFASDEDDWKVVRPREGLMSRFAGNQLAFTAAGLKCDGFLADSRPLAEIGLDPPVARVTVTLAAGEPLVFEIGAEEDTKRFVRAEGKEEVFLVPSFKLFDFLLTAEEMVEKGAARRSQSKPESERKPESESGGEQDGS